MHENFMLVVKLARIIEKKHALTYSMKITSRPLLLNLLPHKNYKTMLSFYLHGMYDYHPEIFKEILQSFAKV